MATGRQRTGFVVAAAALAATCLVAWRVLGRFDDAPAAPAPRAALRPDAGPAPEPSPGLEPPAAETSVVIGGVSGGTCRDGWCWESPLPDGLDIRAVWGSSRTDVWAVGGSVRRWDGSRWHSFDVDAPTELGWTGIHGCAADDVWLVGGGSQVTHFDGARWQTVDTGPAAVVLDVWCRAKNDVWLVGGRGVIRRFDGNRWSTVPSKTHATLYRIAGARPDNAWIVGTDSTVLRFDGSSWRSATTPALRRVRGPHDRSVMSALLPPQALNAFTAVWASAANDAWIGGSRGLFHWDGRQWTPAELSESSGVSALWGFTANDVWAATRTRLFHWDGRAWAPAGEPVSAVRAMWGAGPGDLWLASTPIVHRDLGAATTRSPPGDLHWRAIAADSPTSALVAGNDGAVARLEGGTWRLLDAGGSEASFDTIWIGGEDDVWIAGDPSGLVHWNGTALELVPIRDEDGNRLEVRGGFVHGGNHWVCTRRGLRRLDGDVALPNPRYALPRPDDCRSVVSAGERVWAIFSDTLWEHDGTTWTRTTLPTRAKLGFARLSASGVDDVWIATWEKGQLYHFDGRRWSRTPTPVRAPEYGAGVFAVSSSEAWAWGFHRAGVTRQTAELAAQVFGVGKLPAAQMATPVLLRWDGARWSVVPALTADVGAIGGGQGQLWVAGSGFILRRATATTATAAAAERASVVTSGPFTTEFVGFRQDPRDEPGQRVVTVRLHNPDQRRTAGAYGYEIRYYDASGEPVPVQTRLGPDDHDASRMAGIFHLVGPGETKEIDFAPNHGPIPAAAVRAEVRLLQVCELDHSADHVAFGPCWWSSAR